MNTKTSELWDWMEAQVATAPERGLQALLIDVVEKIENAMTRQGLTRAEVARRAGLKREYVSRILNNPSNVTLATLVRLANAVECKLCCDLMPSIEFSLGCSSPVEESHREETWSHDKDYGSLTVAA
jgi:transcriptional regulator with XRE-family HTH domain